MLGPVVSLLAIGLAFWMVFQHGVFVLRPILDADGARMKCRDHSGIMLSDLFCLVGLLSIPLAIASSINGPERTHSIVQILVLVCVPVTAVWWMGVSSLRELNIRDWKRRVVFLVFVSPYSIFGPIAIVASTIAIFFFADSYIFNSRNHLYTVASFFMLAIYVVSVFMARAASRFVASGIEDSDLNE